MTKHGCKWYDREDRENEEKGVSFWFELLGGQHSGNENQKPEQRVVADLF